MELTVYNMEKKEVGKVSWAEELFGSAPKGSRIHQVVVQMLQNQRQGNADVKNRHEVSGSTRKIYRQKGTGRARHGDIRAPLFVGGGRAFGPRTRNWTTTLPKKIRRGALRDVISLKKNENRLWLLDQLEVKKAKTREIVSFFKKFEIPSGLVVLPSRDEKVMRSIRNLATFSVVEADSLNPLHVLSHDHLILTREAYDRLVKRLA